DTETLVDNEVLNSPFGAAVFAREQENGRGDFFEALSGPLESPFAEAMAVGDETSAESLAFEAVLGEIQSESFDEAVQGLVDEAGPLSFATEQFLGGLIRKAKGLVSGAVNLAKKGLSAVGKLLPIGKIFDALKRLVQPLLKRVLQMAMNKLPASVRPYAEKL